MKFKNRYNRYNIYVGFALILSIIPTDSIVCFSRLQKIRKRQRVHLDQVYWQCPTGTANRIAIDKIKDTLKCTD